MSQWGRPKSYKYSAWPEWRVTCPHVTSVKLTWLKKTDAHARASWPTKKYILQLHLWNFDLQFQNFATFICRLGLKRASQKSKRIENWTRNTEVTKLDSKIAKSRSFFPVNSHWPASRPAGSRALFLRNSGPVTDHGQTLVHYLTLRSIYCSSPLCASLDLGYCSRFESRKGTY